ncbi:MAG: glycosyltransferase family 1 protein [Legionella sp.]|nr:MAG: glycosyltransferase family 1 protein [Legionella sp.]
MDKRLENTRIARISTVPFFVVTQLVSQLEAISHDGALVTVITSKDELSENIEQLNYCDFSPLYIPREINILDDLGALYKLWKVFRKRQFDIVHSTTPKAGLLCAIASRLAGVPIRLHTYTGQVWVNMKMPKKAIIKFCDKLIAFLNTKCYADSVSQKDFLIKNKVASSKKITVLGSGSLAGVDITRFNQNNFSLDQKAEIRDTLNLSDEVVTLLFVGRVTRDKGLYELLEVVSQLLADGYNVSLLVVGPFEPDFEEVIRPYADQLCGNKVAFTGFSVKPEYYMAVADILCIPSYREGFGTVVIEAAAMGVPAVGTNIYGLTDAIIDGETGILVDKKNVLQLKAALQKLVSNKQLREELGANAKRRAINEFASTKCGELLVLEYESLLKKRIKGYNKRSRVRFPQPQ